jgi:UDP-N-acetylglucosamine acyltransferase
MTIHKTADVHPSSVIEEGAEVSAGCKVGPFCWIGSQVKLAKNVSCMSHVVIKGHTSIGSNTSIYSFAVIGEIPQDLKFKGEITALIIGERNRIREHVTINTGTHAGGGVTKIGNDCLMMAGCHIAHDAQVSDRVIIVNSAAIAGHVIIEEDVIVGGLCGIHQFVRLGKGAIIGALSMVTHDVIPYGLVQGSRGQLDGLNLVGLKRAGVARNDITALRAAFQMLAQGDGAFQDRAKRLSEETNNAYVQDIVDFVMGDSDRSFLTPG